MCITSAQFLSLNLSFLFNLFYTLLLVSGHQDYYWIPRLLFFFGYKESVTITPSPLLLFFVIFWESATIIPSPLLLFFAIFGESATIIPSPLLFDTREYNFKLIQQIYQRSTESENYKFVWPLILHS